MEKKSGIALILATGLMALLMLLALSLAQSGRLSGMDARRAFSLAQADLAAESGLSYAEARLLRDPFTLREKRLVARADNACDDWTWRGQWIGEPDSASPSASMNPSYRRGAPWNDNGDGVWTPGETRVDAASGRLRGESVPFSAGFSLKIRSSAGLVCVNSGVLRSPTDDWDMDGILDGDDPGFNLDDSNWNGIPDWRDPDCPGNRHLVNLLNNLGVILKASNIHGYPAELYAPAPRDEGGYDWSEEDQENEEDDDDGFIDEDGDGIPDEDQQRFSPRSEWDVNKTMPDYLTSNLGRRIVLSRPRGGYADIADLKRVLGQAIHDKVRPFLTTRGEIVTVLTNGPFRGSGSWTDRIVEGERPNEAVPFYERRARMDLAAVSPRILEASLMYLSAAGCLFNHGGNFYSDFPLYETLFSRIHRGEAKKLADFIAPKAAGGEITSWAKLLELMAGNSGLFTNDPYTDRQDIRIFQEERNRLKEEMILAAWNANDHFPDLFSRHHNSLDVVRGGAPAPLRVTAAGQINSEWIWTEPYGGMDRSSPPIEIQGRQTATFDLTGGGPRSFEVESEGWRGVSPISRAVARGRSTVDVLGTLTLTSQQDFEQHPGAAPRLRQPGGEVFHDAADGQGGRAGVSTYPLISVSALGSGASYPRAWGDLRLASRQCAGDEDGAIFAICLNENELGDPKGRHSVAVRTDGALLAPCGVRCWEQAGDDDELVLVVWPGEGRPPQGDDFFCLPRATLTVEPAGGGAPMVVEGSGEITKGAIAFWMPGFKECLTARDRGEDPSDFAGARMKICVGYKERFGRIDWRDPVVTCTHRVRYHFGILKELLEINGVETPLPDQGASGHHVVLAFSDDATPEDGKGKMDVYVDGETFGPRHDVVVPDKNPQQSTKFVVQSGPVDDIFFFDRDLPPQEIREMSASVVRFPSSSGTYTSPVFTFEPAHLPEGATLTGLSWDAWFPAGMSGTLTFRVQGFPDQGPSVWSADIVYTADDLRAGKPQNHRLETPLPGCRKVQITARIDVDSSGPLFDTPVIDEIRLLYARWR